MLNILVTPSSFGECGSDPIRLLEDAGFNVTINSTGRRMIPEDVLRLGKECVGLIAGVEYLDAATLAELSRMRVISRLGSGLDNIDLEAAERLGIVVCNTPYGPTRAVAEFTVGATLGLLRRIPQADRNMRRGVWRKEFGQLLQGRVVGILGLGRIGREVAKLMSAFGCLVIGHDVAPDDAWAVDHGIRLVDLSKLLSESDILCLHLTAQADAQPMIGAAELKTMSPGALLINMARGSVLDEDALLAALMNGPLAGAALDVFSEEPYAGPLAQLENVILTPHLGSYARDSKLAMELEAVDNLLRVLGSAN